MMKPRNHRFPSSPPTSEEAPSAHGYHSVNGECPWRHHHYDEWGPNLVKRKDERYMVVGPNCTCTCQLCPRSQPERRRAGDHDGPLRVDYKKPLSIYEVPRPVEPGLQRQTPGEGYTFGVYDRQLNETIGRYIRLPAELRQMIDEFVGDFKPGQEMSSGHFPSDRTGHNLMTFALGQRPCTEKTPWNVRKVNWTDPCPNDRRGLSQYHRRIWKCSDNCKAEYEEDPPILADDPNTPDGRRWVCEDHREDSKAFWEEENLYKAHLVGTCGQCRDEFLKMYPNGYNTCTCRNFLEPWLCRLCYEWRVHDLQNQFRRRVEPSFRARINAKSKDYHRDWKGMREQLAERHPCGRNHPSNNIHPDIFRHHRVDYPNGGKRLLNNEIVMDCRACGGLVVQASARLTRAQRLQHGNPQHLELEFKGKTIGRMRAMDVEVVDSTGGPEQVAGEFEHCSSWARSDTSYKAGQPDANGNPTTSHTLRPIATTGPKTTISNPWDVAIGPLADRLPLDCVQDEETARTFEEQSNDVEKWLDSIWQPRKPWKR